MRTSTLPGVLSLFIRRSEREELYGLTTQMRRASSSIGANLAEGCGRGGDLELKRGSTTCHLFRASNFSSCVSYEPPRTSARSYALYFDFGVQ